MARLQASPRSGRCRAPRRTRAGTWCFGGLRVNGDAAAELLNDLTQRAEADAATGHVADQRACGDVVGEHRLYQIGLARIRQAVLGCRDADLLQSIRRPSSRTLNTTGPALRCAPSLMVPASDLPTSPRFVGGLGAVIDRVAHRVDSCAVSLTPGHRRRRDGRRSHHNRRGFHPTRRRSCPL